jgi:hypothetical protein
MKTFTFANGTVTEGWKLHPEGGRLRLLLGEPGNGRLAFATVENGAPPEIYQGDMVYDCCIHEQRAVWIMAPCCKPQCALLLIRTQGEGQEPIQGRASIWNGQEQKQKLLRGHGLINDRPNGGIWKDYVFLVHPGNFFKIQIGGTGVLYRVEYQHGAFLCGPWLEKVAQSKTATLGDSPVAEKKNVVHLTAHKDVPKPPSHLHGYKLRLWKREHWPEAA